MRHVLTMLTMGSVLSGCAVASEYWHKPTKYKSMPDKRPKDGWDPAVASLSLDASRRLVLSQRTQPEAGKGRFTCPEPPPDVAMNTLAQTLASLETKAGTSVQAGSAYQAVAQALHARTSTVEIWRTTSSMYCVLLMNGKSAEAGDYLKASGAALAASHDTVVTTPAAAAFIDGIMAAAAKRAADEEAKDAATAAKAKADADGAAKKAADLAASKPRCDKVAAAAKPADADCIAVAKADAAKAGGT